MRLCSERRTGDYAGVSLEVYLLPLTSWEDAYSFQQRLVYEIGGSRDRRAALILCEHPKIITVGRGGSRRQIFVEDAELRASRVDVRWTNRGGGCWLQMPGQLAIYPVLPIRSHGLGLNGYRTALYQTLIDVLAEFDIFAERDPQTGVRVGNREIAMLGIAVKDWIAYHGACLNVCMPLDVFDWVQSNPNVPRSMTCMFRERRLPIRIDAVRESVVRHFHEALGFEDYYLCNPPANLSVRRAASVVSGNH